MSNPRKKEIDDLIADMETPQEEGGLGADPSSILRVDRCSACRRKVIVVQCLDDTDYIECHHCHTAEIRIEGRNQ